jgi:hypothetical protein
MTALEWYVFALIGSFLAGATCALVAAGIRTGYWSNDKP